MFDSRKLRPDTSITGPIQPVIVLLIFAVLWAVSGITAALLSLSFIYCCYALLSMSLAIRTGNLWFIVTMIFQFTMAVFGLVVPRVGAHALNRESFRPLVLIIFIEIAVLVYVMATKKLKWRGREILELAAQNIEETSNGFTERPRPLGKIDCSVNELNGFAYFMKRKLIAFPFRETTRLVMVPVMMGEENGVVMGFSSDYTNKSWVAIDKEGNVSAHISKKDYLKYKEALSFDQLCESLGELFIKYFDYYKRGEEIRIMHELAKVKTGPFS
jgi:hypothetical protein